MSEKMGEASGSEIVLRQGTPEDAPACGRVCYNAFKSVATAHNVPSDWPSAPDAVKAMGMILEHPLFYGVVAETGGRIVGSCFLDERASVTGLGPITVDPDFQGRALGRRLMSHALGRADREGARGVRLVQAAYNNQSLSLYAKLGFDVREPLANIQGPPLTETIAGHSVRPVLRSDIERCSRICTLVHGYERGRELEEAVQSGSARLVESGGRLVGYVTAVGFRGHAVAETNEALKALIASAPKFTGSGFLLPARNGEILRWCLSKGLRIVQQMTYMSRGFYQSREGAFLPSILA